MMVASIKVAQSPSDMEINQSFEASTKEVVGKLLELKKVFSSIYFI
jgi:hypothetical protein